MARIEPRTLKGFRDYLPEAMIPRERLVETARRVYRSYGFLPIDTPALELEEILTGKGGEESDKQLYRFEDAGGRRVALRFDLTVPLARFVAQHANELGMPFKRYHVGTVWRGENTQRGRYREFVQCDFDTIGTESVVADVETALVIHDLMRALGFERFTVRVNHRRILTSFLEALSFEENAEGVLRIIDKLDKIGSQGVEEELVASGLLTKLGATEVVKLTVPYPRGIGPEAMRDGLDPDFRRKLERDSSSWELGFGRLASMWNALAASGAPLECFQVDLSIARGLDYYTGAVFETVLDDLPGIGSVCSGGRYDDLASLYTSQRLPGVGASLGLDRLLAAMEELGLVEKRRSTAPVFLAYFEAARLGDYLRLASDLRRAGVGVELYPEPRKLGAQLKYADRRGFPLALVLGEDEWAANRAQVKKLGSGETVALPLRDPSGALDRELVALLSSF